MKTSFRAKALACALLAGTCLSAPAFAQTNPQPAHRNIDANGVDLTHGDFVLSFVEGAIGSGDGELALVRRGNGNGASIWDGIRLDQSITSGGIVNVTISFGHRWERFTSSSSGFVSAQANGATLTAVNGGYEHQSADGTVTLFGDPAQSGGDSQPFCTASGSNQSQCMLLPLSVSNPDGKTIQLSWELWGSCENVLNPDGSQDCSYDARLARVSNSFDYSIVFTYAADGTGGSTAPGPDWFKRTGAEFRNETLVNSAQASVSYAYPASNITDVTDTGGRSWRFTTTSTGIAIRRPGAVMDTTVVTNGSNGVTSVLRDGVTTSYARALSGNTATTTVTNALNQQTVVTSDLTVGRPTSVTDPLNRTRSFQYDTNGRLTRVTETEGNYIQYNLDARGNITQAQAVPKPGSNAAAITVSASYAATCANPVTCNQPLTTTDARGNVTEYEYDPTHGGVVSISLPAPAAGATRPQTRYGYALEHGEYQLTSVSACQNQAGAYNGNPAACAGTADEVKTTISRDANGNITSVSSGNGNGSLTVAQAMTYDPKGDLLTVDGPLTGTADTTRFRYNAARELIGTVSPDPDGTGTLKHRATRNTISGAGFLTKQENGTVESQSDTDWAGFTPLEAVEIGYDEHGRKILEDLKSGSTVYSRLQHGYDALGRLECTAQRMNVDALTPIPVSACDLGPQGSFGPDRISRTIYDAAGQVVKQQTGVGVTGVQADEVTSTYTGNGKIATVTDAEGNMTAALYDGLDRLKQVSFPSPTTDGVANSADYEEFDYDPASNVTSRRLRDGQVIAYSYDAVGRPTSKDLPGAEADVTYSYDNLGRLLSAVQGASTLSFSYDALGRQLTEAGQLGTFTSSYDLAGRRTALSHPDGFYVSYDYLVTGETSKVRENGATSGAGVLATFSYDDLGRRTQLVRGNGTSTGYGYDPVSRLASLSHNLGATSGDLDLGFTYNPASQILSNTRSNDLYAWTGHNNGSTASIINGLNQIVTHGGANVTHDLRGNITNDGAKSYAYSSENLLRTISANGTTHSLSYDPAGRLSQTSFGAVTSFGYDGLDLVMESNSSGIARRYVHGTGMDEPLVWYEGSGTSDRRWLHADERGSIVAASDNSDSLIGVNKYDEYGVPQGPSGVGTLLGRFGYTGQVWLPEIGLFYYKARVYDPKLGRFMQPDPIRYEAGMNLYAYVGNDPVNFVDPLGLDPECGGMPCDVPIEIVKKVERDVMFDFGWGDNSLSIGDNGVFGGGFGFGPLYEGGGGPPAPSKEQQKQCKGPPVAPNTGATPGELMDQARNNAIQAAKHAFPLGLGWFRNQVRNRGPWDYKQYTSDRSFENFGNYNYGYAGTAAGIPAGILLRQAGVAQIAAGTSRAAWGKPGNGIYGGSGTFGDQPSDQAMIKRGIEDRKNGC